MLVCLYGYMTMLEYISSQSALTLLEAMQSSGLCARSMQLSSLY